jgi:diguanylate cyclase (GGDEF)-like protein
LIAMLLPVALAVNTENLGNDTRFFKCSFTKKEGVFLVAATIIVYVMMKLGTYHDSFFGRHIILHNSVLQNVVFLANTTFIIIYIFYYLSSYAVYINKSEEFLRQKADYDELTGLYNRNRIRFILEHNYAAAKEGNNPFGVAIMDIDDFKKINDGYGHNAGDFVLKRFAGIVDGIVRKCEGQIVAGRWGGEEFLILYYGENKEDFYMLLEYIRMKIYEAQFLYDRNRLSVSVTIGMAAFAKDMSLDEIINNADMKLYEGKKSGKNKVM